MNELQIFESPQFGQIRTKEINGKTYFSAKDVASALGYVEPAKAMRTHCKNVVAVTFETAGGKQLVRFIPEGDVYRLIVKSKLPSAEKFEKWVFEEVLPSIRKHGLYAMDDLINNPDLAIKALTALKEEREKNAKLEAVNEELKPKAQLADAVTGSPYTISVGEMAKILNQNGVDIGQNRFYKWLRANGYIMGTNTPTQKAMELKIFVLKESTVCLPDGTQKLVKTPRVTGKGQEYFLKKFAVAAV